MAMLSPAALSLTLSQTLPSKPSIQISQSHFPSLSILTYGTPRTIDDTGMTSSALAEAVVFAKATAEAAKDVASSSPAPLRGFTSLDSRRRRRRRKRRDVGSPINQEPDSSECLLEGCFSRSERSANLTTIEEAEFSLLLKEETMLEKQIEDCSPSDSGYAAIDARMNKRSVERKLLKARECRERITLSYRRLVVSIAAPYQGKGLSLQDLIQDGCIGLLRGAQRFDPRKGYKLSTYAYWWIKQAIIKALADKSRIVRLPGSLCSHTTKVADATSLLTRRLGRSPTYEEVAEYLGISVSSVRILSERSRYPISIDQPMNRGVTLRDILPGPDEIRPEAMYSKQMRSQTMEKLLKTLSEREEYIIRLYYGLDGETARSCEEIGRLLNLSRERVRQIHCIALTKLQEDKCMLEGYKHSII